MIVSWRVVLGSVFFGVEIMAPKRKLVRGITLNSKLLKVEMNKLMVILAFRSASRILKEVFLLLYVSYTIN